MKNILQLTHKDVVLDFFESRGDTICKLRSGDALNISEKYNSLYAKINGRIFPVAKFSKAFLERLGQLRAKGYRPDKAYVNFIVLWKGDKDTDETLVLLPTLHLTR